MAGASESSAGVVPSKERRFSLLEEARTSRAPPQETRPEMTEGEKHMKRRKNRFRQALEDKREALASAAKQPKPELEEESDYERRIRAWTSQGYTRTQAEQILEFSDREGIG